MHGQNSQFKNIKDHIYTQAVKSDKNWLYNRFILYSARGNNLLSGFKNSRTIILDKSTFNVRLEIQSVKGELLVCLFNFQTNTIKKIALDKKIISNSSVLAKQVLVQFHEDVKLLFLPLIISANQSSLTYIAQQIVNTRIIHIYDVKRAKLLNLEITNGEVHLGNQGNIVYFSDNNQFNVSEIKDIGSGIELPTKYQCIDMPSKSCNFITVAAFTEIEAEKFEIL